MSCKAVTRLHGRGRARRGPFSHVWMEGKEGGEKGDGYGKGGAIGAVMRFAWVTDEGWQG